MMMGTPQSEQGQIVEYSYGWCDGVFYRRSLDRSDRSERWWRADSASADALMESEYDAGGATHPPDVAAWTPCPEPSED